MAETTSLRPVDLLLNEEHILEQAARVCPFRTGHVTFPRSIPEGMADGESYRSISPPGEDKLFIPLVHRGRLLGVLFLDGTPSEPDSLWLQALGAYMERSLETIELTRQKRSDVLTGLLQQEALLEDLEREIRLIAENALASEREADPGGQGYRGEVALLAIQVPEVPEISENKGYLRAEEILLKLARELTRCCPASCPAARLDNYRLGVMIPGTGPTTIRQTAERIQSHLEGFSTRDVVSGEDMELQVDLGLTIYPRDLFGRAASSQPREQARILLANALRAVATASSQSGRGTLFSFSSILTKGGRIRNILTEDRVLVDLGRKDRAREGQVFAVQADSGDSFSPWPADRQRSKAEIMLIDTGEETSLAQILRSRPGTSIAPADRLFHQPHPEESSLKADHPTPRDNAAAGGLLSLPGFLSAWRRRCREEEVFCLALLRVNSGSPPGGDGSPDALSNHLEQILPTGGLAGSYGSDCYILYLPGTGPERARELLQGIAGSEEDGGHPTVRAGIGYYPCLNYSRLDVAETARNALEHAELLSGNAVTVFDSLSLTVSADRHYARGDLAEAITDYQQALLLDPENLLARNSLAICHAHLGRTARAEQELRSLLDRDPENVMALYNLGCLSLKAEQLQTAEDYFQRCLGLEPQQHFCLIRLGRIREHIGDHEGARDYYLRTLKTPQGERYAHKHLARLDASRGDREAARNNLQKALRANPWDPEALHLMARLYLEVGEDLELVESLARRCFSLRPDLEEHVRLLEEVLIARGKREEARNLRPERQETG